MDQTSSLDSVKSSPLDILMSAAGSLGSGAEDCDLFSSMVTDASTPDAENQGAVPGLNVSTTVDSFLPAAMSAEMTEGPEDAASALAQDLDALKGALFALRKIDEGNSLTVVPKNLQETEETAGTEAVQAGETDVQVLTERAETEDIAPEAEDDNDETLSGIVAEILALAQQIIQALHQTQSLQGGSASTSETAQDTLTQMASNLDLTQTLKLDETPKGLLLELMKKIEKSAQQVLNDFASNESQTPVSTTNDIVASLVSDNVERLKDTASGLQTILDDVRKNKEESSFPQAIKTERAEVPVLTTAIASEETEDCQAATENTNAAPAKTEEAQASVDEGEALAMAVALAPARQKSMANADQSAGKQVAISAPTSALASKTSTTRATPITIKSEQSTAIARPPASDAPVGTKTSEKKLLTDTVLDPLESQAQSPDLALDTNSLLNNGSSFDSFVESSGASWTSAEKGQVSETYSFASTLSSFRAANGGTAGLPSAVDQVVLQMNRNVKNGHSQMSMQLHPSDLGKITVKLEFSEGDKVQGTVVADNPKTLEMLQKDSRSLERALQDAGLRAESGSLQFSLGERQNDHSAGQTADSRKSGSSGYGMVSAEEPYAEITALSERYYITPTGVNIQV
ncbi:MAG: flagellar hook-length control protein FliK [Alphaproteobacteria bacterium]|nr:flagellar hook-length control protein FliK [Alphaproteobacteria bacterium]